VSKTDAPPPKATSEFAMDKQPEKQMMQSEASVASTPSRLEWTKTAQASRSAQIFVLAMLIAALFAGIPFAGYFRFLSGSCSYMEGIKGIDYDCYNTDVNSYALYKNMPCMLGGFILMLLALFVFVARVVLGSFSIGSTKIGRLIGLDLDIITAVLIFVSVILVSVGGIRLGSEYDKSIWDLIRVLTSSDRIAYKKYPAAFNIAIPMQATYSIALFGAIALIIFDFLALFSAFRAAR